MTKENILEDMLDAVSEEHLKGMYCPCCGQPNKFKRSPEWILLHFSGLVQRILILLLEKRRINHSAEMYEFIRVGYTEAGLVPPVNAATSITVTMNNARKRLNSLGWDYIGPRTTGKGYMLVMLE